MAKRSSFILQAASCCILGMPLSCGPESGKPKMVEYVTAAQLFNVADFKGDKGHNVEIMLTSLHEGTLTIRVDVKIGESWDTTDGTKFAQSWKKSQAVIFSAKGEQKKVTFGFPQTNPDKMHGGELETTIWRMENNVGTFIKRLHEWIRRP